jgi:7tm Chemosensory receptor
VLKLKKIHHDLMQCVRMVNIIFSFQTMLCVSITFLFTLFTLFTAFKTFFYHEHQLINMSLSTLYWCLFYNFFKGCIIYTCNLVDTEAEKLPALTFKMMSRNVCQPMVMEAFAHQVKQLSGKSTCGLFNFDYSLIMMVSADREICSEGEFGCFQFVSSVATYFIILIQFESSIQSKNGRN